MDRPPQAAYSNGMVCRGTVLLALSLGVFMLGCRPAASVPPSSGRGAELETPPPLTPSATALAGPFGLFGEDGKAVGLRAVEARAEITGPIARTEVVLRFDALPAKGPGELAFVLPEGAALHGFAVEAGGVFYEAELVAEEATAPARRTAAHAGGAGGTGGTRGSAGAGDARVHSVELADTGAPPQVRLTYVEALGLGGYRLPLKGLPALERLTVAVKVGQKSASFGVSQRNEVPEDFVVGAAEVGGMARVAALRAGKFGVARVSPKAEVSSEITLLVDTSRSQPMALDRLASELERVSEELARAPAPPLVSVVGFDQEVYPIVLRARPPLGAAALAPLKAMRRLGGTDFTYAVSTAIATGIPHRHLVLFSDFVNSVAPTGNAFNMRDALARLDAVGTDAASTERARSMAEQWSRRGSTGVVVGLDGGPKLLAAKLLEPTPGRLRVEVSGAEWSSLGQWRMDGGTFPEVGRGLWVFAELAGEAPLTLAIDGKPEAKIPPVRDPALAVLLGSLVAQARFAELEHEGRKRALSRDDRVRSFAAEHRLLPRSLAFRVTAKTARGPKLLARRLVEPPSAPEAFENSKPREPEAPESEPRCPEMMGFFRNEHADGSCPPLLVSFEDAKQRLIADVKFAGGALVPAQSPHVADLATLFGAHPELEELGVRAANRAQAEAVIRHLESQGVARGRLVVDRPLDSSERPRKATPRCKTPGERVVFEVRRMGLRHLEQRIQKRTPAAEAKPAPTRFGSIRAFLQHDDTGRRPPDGVEKALRASERWVDEERDNPLAYVALGDALDASRDELGAVRAYGSLYDFELPGAGLKAAAAARLALTVGATPEARRHGGTAAQEARMHDVAVQTFRREWQDHRDQRAEGSRGYAYAVFREGRDPADAYGQIYEAAKPSDVARQLELPVFAHVYLSKSREASASLAGLMPRKCLFPMQAAVHGAVLSWEDTESELEVSVRSKPKNFVYDSVLADAGGSSRARYLPLPADDDAYPIEVSVRAVRLGPRGYAFAMLRVLNYNGRGRLHTEEKPVVLSRTGESAVVYTEQILQVPQ